MTVHPEQPYTAPSTASYNDMVDRLFTLHPPANEETAKKMDGVRERYIDLGHYLSDRLPSGPDKTIAIRKLHEALMAAIAAIACNQE